jgi:HD-GYP domain-containing protein (c-di-GMP phosphodiesterase class II)
MKQKIMVDIGNLTLTISDAIDLASPLLAQHQQRVGFIVWELAKAAQFPAEMTERLFLAALLHDVGAFSVEEKLALYVFEEKNCEPHCIRGEILFRQVPWLLNSAEIIRHHHRAWEEWDESIDQPPVLASQILYMADNLERLINRNQYILHQNDKLLSRIKEGAGNRYHPQVVDWLMSISRREEFWLDLVSPRLYALLLHNGPFNRMELSLAGMRSFTTMIQYVIDFRSRFTATHSAGVATCAESLAKLFGFTVTEMELMKIAGSLHDLGKLAIPNRILDKPGALLKDEFAFMKSHTYFTYALLNTIAGFERIAEWAAFHHERLDGSGYPFRCQGAELDTGARLLMVADLFTALAEDRPYRKGMAKEKIINILEDFGGRGLLDEQIIMLALDNYSELYERVNEEQAETKKFYENQFAG